MTKILSRLLLKLMGWNLRVNLPAEVHKAVVLVAPHTSNIDFFIGKLAFISIGMKVSFLIKKEAFFFPLAGMLKYAGGIPVDRKKKTNLVDQLVEQFHQKEELFLVVTPEGTRSYSKYWKKGFYHIANNAHVPLAIGYLDFKEKKIGIKELFYPTGNLEHDFSYIREQYQNVHARHPEKYCKNPQMK